MSAASSRVPKASDLPTTARHPAQLGALLVGLAYLAIGLIGFIATGFSGWVVHTGDSLLGFGLNGFHNIVHLGVGVILIGAAFAKDPAITQGVLIGGGLVYLLAAVLGFTGNLDQLLSINGTLGPDNFLHLGSGAAAVVVGLLSGDVSKPEVEVHGP